EDDIEVSTLGLHGRVESVEVGQIGDRALHRAGIGSEVRHSGVERFLPATEDEDERTLLDEALCCGAPDAGSTTGDHGGLSIQFVHVMHPSLERAEAGNCSLVPTDPDWKRTIVSAPSFHHRHGNWRRS